LLLLFVGELFFLKHIAQCRIVRMPETILSVHGQLFTEVLAVIYADGLRIGKAIRAAPAASPETTPETPATAPPPGAAAADVEVKRSEEHMSELQSRENLVC